VMSRVQGFQVGAYTAVKPSQSLCVADEWKKSIAETSA
jgi:hypothetical protein